MSCSVWKIPAIAVSVVIVGVEIVTVFFSARKCSSSCDTSYYSRCILLMFNVEGRNCRSADDSRL